MNQPLTDLDLDEIAARAATLYEYADPTDAAWEILAGEDVPALLAEVHRLRAELTDSERTMLTYALDQAQEHIWSRDGFTDEDQAAVDSLRARAAAPVAAVSSAAENGDQP